MKKILFYNAQEYYWPSLYPVYLEFEKENDFDLYVMVGKNQKRFLKMFLFSQKNKIEKEFKNKGFKITNTVNGFDAVFCGAQIKHPEKFGNAILCNLDHGPGIKTLRYRHLLKQKNIKYHCFLEGQYRVEKFRKYGLDKFFNVYETGLPKLDVFFNEYYNKNKLIEEYKLDPDKKTVLYAPSYKPTSIFSIGYKIPPLLVNYNIIVKLHPYSWQGKYASHSHHKFFEKIKKHNPEIHLVGPDKHNILPYMFIADAMISDGSSVINEFLAMEKVGIIVDLEGDNLSHHDGESLLEDNNKTWLKNSFIHISPEGDLDIAVREALAPSNERIKNIRKDKKYIFSYSDGKSAFRVKEIVKSLIYEKKSDE